MGRKAIPLDQRFETYTIPEPNSGCLIWIGAWSIWGYGVIEHEGRTRPAHRVAYEHFRGPILAGRHIDHLCRTRCCVNPDHLEPVTVRMNLLRGKTKAAANRAKTHCPQGHPYSGENLKITHNFGRACRECARIDGRRRHAANPEPRGIANKDKTHCLRGHLLAGDNLGITKSGRWAGARYCRTCNIENSKARHAKYKAARIICESEV